MDDGLSSIDPQSLYFNVPHSDAFNAEEEEARREAELREKLIDADLETKFDDLITDETDVSESECHEERSFNYTQENELPEDLNSQECSEYSPRQNYHLQNKVEQKTRHHSYTSDNGNSYHEKNGHVYQSNSEISHGNSHVEHGYHNEQNYYNGDSSVCASDNMAQRSLLGSGGSNTGVSEQYADANHELTHENYLKLKLMYETTRQKLEEYKEYDHQEIKALNLKIALLEEDKERLGSCLQKSQELLSTFQKDNIVLKNQASELSLQLTSARKAEEEVLAELEKYRCMAQSLDVEMNAIKRSESISRIRDQHDSVVKDLKLRHQKEVLHLKENLDELQRDLNEKIDEAENFRERFVEIGKKFEDLQIEKSEIFHKLSSQLNECQRQNKDLLGLGNAANKLNIQVHQLEEEKTDILRQNLELESEVKILKAELKTRVILKELNNSTSNSRGKHDYDGRQTELCLQSELERTLTTLQSQKSINESLKKDLLKLKTLVPSLKEKAKLYESKFSESELHRKELEDRLSSLSESEVVPTKFHENETRALELELNNLKTKLHDISEKYNEVSINERKLQESNEELQKTISEMIQKHTIEKLKAVEECREKYLEHHENVLKKEKQKLLSRSDSDFKNACTKYENKISDLEKEVKHLQEGLYDSKSQYVNLYEENKTLQIKLKEISTPKERTEIEADLRQEYEKKLNQIKEQLDKQTQELFKKQMKTEVEKAQVLWTQEKVSDIKDFIDTTKKRLDEEFQKCLKEERDSDRGELEAELLKLRRKHQEQMVNLQQQFEVEKQNLSSKLSENAKNHLQDVKSNFQKETNELRDQQVRDIKFLRNQYESKIVSLETEIKNLQDELSVRVHNPDQMSKVVQDHTAKQESLQKEIAQLSEEKSFLKKQLRSSTEIEKKLKEKNASYKSYFQVLKKNWKDKEAAFQTQISKLQNGCMEKKSENATMTKKYEQVISELKDKLRSTSLSCKNCEVQTQEEMYPKKALLQIQEMFLNCIREIIDDIKIHLQSSSKRVVEKVTETLSHFCQTHPPKYIQNLPQYLYNFTPSIVIPQTRAKAVIGSSRQDSGISSYKASFADKHKIQTSTPDTASGNVKFPGQLSDILGKKHTEAVSESTLKFEDVSFDFTSLKPSATFQNSHRIHSWGSEKLTDFL